MKYCVFSLDTGIIRQRFDTPRRDAEKQLRSGEALYFGDADPLVHRIVKGDKSWQVINCVDEDLGDGSIWSTEEGRRLSAEDQAARRASVTLIRMRMLDTQTVEIDGEKINLQRSLLEYVTAPEGSKEEIDALSRLQKVKARKDALRAEINDGKDTSEP